MPRLPAVLAVSAVLAVLVLCPACQKDSNGIHNNNDMDASSDTDSDSDTDADSDGDSDSDSDSDTDADSDTDTDTDADTDTDSDGDWLPDGCQIVSTDSDWTVERGFYGNRMVWIDRNTDSEMPDIRVRNLDTAETAVVVEDLPGTGYYDHVSIWSDWVYWDWQTDGSDSFTRELYRKNLETSEVQQLTDSECASYLPMPGETAVVFYRGCEGDTLGTLYFLDLDDLEIHLISAEASGNPGGHDFDGTKWVVWLDEVGMSVVNWLWKYDVQNGVGPTLVQSGMTQITWPKIDDGKVYSGTWDDPVDMTNKCDVRVHDLETDVGEWVFHSPWDQIGPTVSGRVLAYEDTEELAHNWFDDQTSFLELYDLDTGATRKLTEVAAPYTGIARHDKYFAYNLGDYLILCDLEAGGFIDATGHVCPEGGCPEMDGGVDAGK